MPEQTPAPSPVPYHCRPINEVASAHAPFIYFEEAPTFGVVHGVVRITLEAASIHSAGETTLVTDRIVVAHLRMNIPAARALKAAIESALLLAQTPQSSAKN